MSAYEGKINDQKRITRENLRFTLYLLDSLLQPLPLLSPTLLSLIRNILKVVNQLLKLDAFASYLCKVGLQTSLDTLFPPRREKSMISFIPNGGEGGNGRRSHKTYLPLILLGTEHSSFIPQPIRFRLSSRNLLECLSRDQMPISISPISQMR